MNDKLTVVHDNPDMERPTAEGRVFQFNAGTIDELRRRKIIRDHEEHVELPYPEPGEERVGELNEVERALFLEMAMTDQELGELHKELVARSLEIYAASVRGTSSMGEAMRKFADQGENVFPNNEEAEAYFELHTRHEYVRAHFNYAIRERFGHGATYGVRHGFALFRTGKKYTLPK